jgi:pimeloyl-ACP methyl ester carboxylesterase
VQPVGDERLGEGRLRLPPAERAGRARAGDRPALAAFPRPVRLIWGGGDPYLNRGVAEQLRGRFRTAELTVLRAGHWPQIDEPEAVARALLALPAAAPPAAHGAGNGAVG